MLRAAPTAKFSVRTAFAAGSQDGLGGSLAISIHGLLCQEQAYVDRH